jgi:hypothetical protein
LRLALVAQAAYFANLYIAISKNDLTAHGTSMARNSTVAALIALFAAFLIVDHGGARAAGDVANAADLQGALAKLPGRWTGEGRLGFKDGQKETVTCRATYFAATETPGLKQTIRCASASGKIELKSRLEVKDGVLSGEWSEEMYNLKGELQGKVSDRGLVVAVKGADLNANMDVIVKDNRQIVEIQFHNTTLVGLTLILTRSVAGGES